MAPSKPTKEAKYWMGKHALQKKETPAEVAPQLYAVSKFLARPPLREKRIIKKLTSEEKTDLRKKRKLNLRNFKKSVGSPKRPVFLPIVAEKKTQGPVEPPYNMKVNTHTKMIEIRVYLHKVPEQYITVDCTATHFVFNTLKWTTQYQLNVKYIDGIQVNPKKATAEFNYNTLIVKAPVTVFSEIAKKKQMKISAAIREGKSIRFVQGRNTELIGIRKREQQRKSSKTIDNVVRASARSLASGDRKKKLFLQDKERALDIVEQVAAEEEKKVAAKQMQMGKIAQYVQARTNIIKERKERKMAAKDKSLKTVVDSKKRKLDEVWESALVPLSSGQSADTSKKRVSFAATPEVATYTRGSDSKSKKKRKERINIQYE